MVRFCLKRTMNRWRVALWPLSDTMVGLDELEGLLEVARNPTYERSEL